MNIVYTKLCSTTAFRNDTLTPKLSVRRPGLTGSPAISLAAPQFGRARVDFKAALVSQDLVRWTASSARVQVDKCQSVSGNEHPPTVLVCVWPDK